MSAISSAELKAWAAETGLDLIGVAPAGPTPHWKQFREWVEAGYAGEMAYLSRTDALLRREDPRRILSGARTVLVVAVSVASPIPQVVPPLHGRVALYAWRGDYHRWLLQKLTALVDTIAGAAGGEIPSRCYVDTGPLIERDWAAAAGLGWIGRNGCLINPRLGSHLLLGVALLGIELPPTPEATLPTCGSCTRCVDACPTQAIVAPGVIDSRRCLSYLTIEHRGAIPESLRSALGDRVFGCDVCQQVCPWNARPLGDQEVGSEGLSTLALPELLALDEEGFRLRFRATALWRATPAGLARNAAVVLGNLGDPSARGCLTQAAAGHSSLLVREHALWALGRL